MRDKYIDEDGNEISYDDLICKCGKKADEMYDEADTALRCDCGKFYYHKIWE